MWLLLSLLLYYYYRKWASLFEFNLLLERLRDRVRINRNQKMEPSLGIIDRQSVKWGNNRSLNGIDGNKRVKGIKRHVIVDKNGFLIAIMVTIANVHDSKAAYLLMRVLKEICLGVKVILADGGYWGELIENTKNCFEYVIQVVISSYREQGFRPIHKRWIIEWTLSWLYNNGRLSRNDELTFDSVEEIVKIAAIRLLLKKI